MSCTNKITIDGVKYVRADSVSEPAKLRDGMKYVIVRCAQASPFAGYLAGKNGSEVTLHDARRIYYWAGASSLSELAMKGPGKPNECKFPAAVDSVTLLGVIEILDVTEAAREKINSVHVWTSQ